MCITNIAGYKFIPLDNLSQLRTQLLEQCQALEILGTILLSAEGVNINLAGAAESIFAFKNLLSLDERFSDMTFRESFSEKAPFKFLRVKLRREIITMKNPAVKPEVTRAPAIAPNILKQWLDEKRDITLLDTRNDYEVRFGTFKKATHLAINDFSDFPKAATALTADKPVVMFCTGGIRCEKAALELLHAGFPEVYQLEGGILNYFQETDGAHYEGECFVFDERVALDTNLQVTGTLQCVVCEGPQQACAHV